MSEDTRTGAQGVAEAISFAARTLANRSTVDTGQEYESVFDWMPSPTLEAEFSPEGLPFYTAEHLRSCLEFCDFMDNFLRTRNPIVYCRALRHQNFLKKNDFDSEAIQSFMQEINEMSEDQANGATALAALAKASLDALAVYRTALEGASSGRMIETDVLASIGAAQEQLKAVETAFRQIERMLHQTNDMFWASQKRYNDSWSLSGPAAARLARCASSPSAELHEGWGPSVSMAGRQETNEGWGPEVKCASGSSYAPL